jgi:ABC-type sugar transport system permease subunit
MLFVYLWRLIRVFSVLDCVFELNAEQLLHDVTAVLIWQLESVFESCEYGRVALLCILLFMVTMVISLVELRVCHSESLYELDWGKGLTLEVKVGEETLSRGCHQLVLIVA